MRSLFLLRSLFWLLWLSRLVHVVRLEWLARLARSLRPICLLRAEERSHHPVKKTGIIDQQWCRLRPSVPGVQELRVG
jgi:hypothetical protein